MKCQRCKELDHLPAWERCAHAAADLENAIGDLPEGLVSHTELVDIYTMTTRLGDLFAKLEKRAEYSAEDAAADAADAAYSSGEVPYSLRW